MIVHVNIRMIEQVEVKKQLSMQYCLILHKRWLTLSPTYFLSSIDCVMHKQIGKFRNINNVSSQLWRIVLL